jgi:peroxiredoxin Q/BCP
MTEQVQLTAGDIAPEFTLPDETGTLRSLSEFRGKKVIVFCYPKAMTPGCTTEACDFRDSASSLTAAGYQVLGISPDPSASLAKFIAKEGLTYPLLGDESRETLTAYGAFGEKKNYGKIVQGVIRSTFIIDEDGKITEALYNVKATGHVARIRKIVGLD